MKTAILKVRPAASACSAFTMVEIALCLAIIGFALVAIIGVLPAGLNVQKENREETILNQDSTVWMDAIRSGSVGYDELTNYVDRIVISNAVFNANGVQQTPWTLVVTAQREAGIPLNVQLNTGGKIIGLLSTPKIQPDGSGGYTNNVVMAYCRAISGSAVEKKPNQNNAELSEAAFSYRMSVDVVPAGSIDPENIQTNAADAFLRRNLTDVRLFMRWPFKKPFNPNVAADPVVGDSSRITFRSQASGRFVVGGTQDLRSPGNTIPLYFIQPREFR